MTQPRDPACVSRPQVVQSLNSPFFSPPIGAEHRANEKRVQDNLHAHAENEPINYAALVNVSRNAFFSSRSKKNLL